MLARRLARCGCAVGLLCAVVGAARAEDDSCTVELASTYDLIQSRVFDAGGCTNAFCHSGDFAAAGLDLTAGRSYPALVDQPSTTVAGAVRVTPAQKEDSLLWLNVAAATLPGEWNAPLGPMPPGSILPPLSLDQLEVLRLWIESGAPETGVVPGTAALLQACLPPPEPIEIAPLPPPPPDEGVQLAMPRWQIAAESEREVCFATYYDVGAAVPEEFRGPSGDTFFYDRAVVRQDPLSHQLVAKSYTGPDLPENAADWPPLRCAAGGGLGRRCDSDTDCAGPSGSCMPVWPPFLCQDGPRSGTSCNPIALGDCGAGGTCVTEVETSVGCMGFGPPDQEAEASTARLIGSQEAGSVFALADGVYGEAPLRAMVLWSSHAFNLTSAPGKLQAWINFSFAAPGKRLHPVREIFDTSAVFAARTPPFRAEEVCRHHVLPSDTRLFQLGSHTHKRGKRFRTFLGAWRCDGGPNAGNACSPFGRDLAYDTPDLCAGAPCGSALPPAACDCDADGRVAVGELILALNIALAHRDAGACPDVDPNRDGAVTIDEILLGVASALNPARDPATSLLYTNLVYDDPPRVRFDPPLAFPGAGSTDDERTLTYCALYDNGFADAAQVKRRSASPVPPLGLPLGGPCAAGEACVNDGRIGAPCSGESDEERDASCDSAAAAGDGLCDACTLTGGLTTEDEMFVLTGQFFVPR